jgi:hypothetical protein
MRQWRHSPLLSIRCGRSVGMNGALACASEHIATSTVLSAPARSLG